MAEHNDFGKVAEDFIADLYTKKGYTILERNWYFHPAEIDIIALKGEILAIVEVKARSSHHFENPEDAVNKAKKHRLIQAADAYIQQNDLEVETRFDIAVVIKHKNKLSYKMFIDAFLSHEV